MRLRYPLSARAKDPDHPFTAAAYVIQDDSVVVHGVRALGRKLGAIEVPDLLENSGLGFKV